MLLRILRSFIQPSSVAPVMGINERNRSLVRVHNPRNYFPLADDKLRTTEILIAAGVPVPKTLAVFSSMYEVRHAAERLKHLADFVIKPSQGKAGKGILVLVERTASGWFDHGHHLWTDQAVGHHIANIVFGSFGAGLADRALVQERLLQAPIFGTTLFPGLPDIRVITLRGRPVMAMVRVPTKRSRGKANLHQGGVGVGVDIKSGRTTHASFRGAPIQRHPDSGDVLVGRSIPEWPVVIDVAGRAASALPLGYLGIDVALDSRLGPVVLEANARPGLEIQNVNHRGLKEALAHLNYYEVTA